jgi:transposase InsO family protein
MVLRMDNGAEMISQALQQFCAGKVGLSYIPPGAPWDNGYIESFNNRLRKECLNRNHWTNLLEARVVIGDFKHEHNHRQKPLDHRYHQPGRLRRQTHSDRTSRLTLCPPNGVKPNTPCA